jgi:protein-S-isoprenylcysteine O-methyltransferase Ste14
MILRVVLWFVVILFPVSEIVLALLKRASSRVANVQDRGSMRLLWLVIATSVCLAIAFQWVPAARLHLSAVFLQALALGLMIAGLAVRWVSIFTLGRFFTVDVAIHNGHTLVEVGLYRHLRHPSYSGLLLAFLGLGVMFANWLSFIAIVVPITLAVLNRIAKEESALRDALGASYVAYCSRTKRLVPGLF